jgi:uncharacterized protein with FMN-binding domain
MIDIEKDRLIAGRVATGPAAPKKKQGTRKMTRRLVALSAAAILAVYGVGYARTEGAAAQIAAQSSQVATIPPSGSAPGALAAATATPTAAATSGYKDGTYVGSGNSRHGGIQAQVVIQGGTIVSATITRATTRYPASAIASLPREVVSAQGTNVDLVSGATDSSEAYLQAVDNALSQAV